MAIMTKRWTSTTGLQMLTLFLVCFLAVCRADDLMVGEESDLSDAPINEMNASKKLDLVFLVHTSTNINKHKFNYYKQFLRDIVQNADIDSGKVRVAFVMYRKRANLLFNLKKYKTRVSLLEAFKNITASRAKEANIAAGLNFIKSKIFNEKAGDRADAPNVVIVLTDSASSGDIQVIQKSAQALKAAGTRIFAVGVAMKDVSQLGNIASAPSDVHNPSTFVSLGKVKDDIVAKIPALLVKDEPGDATSQSADHSAKVDVAIVFHLSQDIKPQDITKYFNPFLVAILEKANIDGGDVRVALINYAKKARITFNLTKYKTTAQINEEIMKIDRKARTKVSSAGSALEDVRKTIFGKRNEDRADAPNVVILITDEKNSDEQKEFLEESAALKAAGFKLVTVGVQDADAAELRSVASEPVAKNAIFASSYAAIASPSIIDSVRSTVRALQGPQAAVIPPVVRTPAPVRPTQAPEVSKPGFDLRRVDSVDLAFAIHFDPKRSNKDYESLISSIVSIIDNANIDGRKVRVSLYIGGRGVMFDFDRFSTSEQLRAQITRLSKRNFNVQKFNVVETLLDVRTQIFEAKGEERNDVANGLIIITDTSSGQDRRLINEEKQRLIRAGVQVYSVGIGLGDKSEMEEIATTDRNVFSYADYNDLSSLGTSFKNEIYALRGTQPPTAKPGPIDRITLPAPTDCALSRADLIVVIDSSTSVTEVNFKKVLLFVKDFLRKSDIDSGNVRVGVVVYSTDIHQIFQLRTYTRMRDILQAVDRIPYTFGSTNTTGALNTMREVMFTPVNGDRPGVPNFAIVITDGVSSVPTELTISAARQAHEEGIHIYSIGIGLTDYRELDGIASPPARENSFKVANFDELQTVDDIIFASACPKIFTMPPPTLRPITTTTTTTSTTTERPTPPPRRTRAPPTPRPTTPRPTTPSPTTPRPTTPRPTTPRPTTTTTTTTTRRTTTTTTRRPTTTTTRRTTTTTTRRPTTPRRIPKYSDVGTDLIFMLDSSVDARIFEWMKRFVRDFTQQLSVDSGEVRVGGMTFDTRSRADFHLNRYNFQDEIISNIDRLRSQSVSGRPDIGDAFDYVRRSMFTPSNGDRAKARNYVILLTGNEKSANAERTYSAADRLKDSGTGIFSVGLNFRNSTELDRISSDPSDQYVTLINSEEGLRQIAGIYTERLSRAPPLTPRPVVRTTPAPVTRRPTRQIDYVPTGECKAKGDVIFVLDTSGSVGEYNFGLMKNFTYETVKDLEVDNGFFRIGVITFSDSSRIEFQLKTHSTKREIFDAIQRIPYIYGYTHTAEALRRVRTEMFTSRNGDRPDVPNLLVVVTDGHSNVNHEETLPEARLIKSTGTTIVTVAVGLEDNSELRGLTSEPKDENMIEVTDFESLNRLSRVIVSPLCSDVNLCDRNPCRNEGVCVDGLRSYICVCTAGYYGENCEKSCGPAADVVLILDSSTSVGSQNFNLIKGYAQEMVSEMNVETCNINVGVIKYSSAAMIQFNLGVHDTEDEILRAIQVISYTPGRANMAEAIRYVRTQMFNGRNGDRSTARNIAFLLSDGSAEINRDITASEVELSIDAGIRLIPIGISLRDRTEIEYIAESQGISLVEFDSDTKFMAMSDQVLEAVYDDKTATDHCLRNPCLNGAQCINAPLGFTCVCAEGYAGDLCERACSGRADVVIVVDSSRYNSAADFQATKRFLKNVIKRISFKSDNFRVAVVEYGSSPRTRLQLLEGDNKRTVNSVIGALRRLGGDPNLESAIKLVSTSIFDKNGDRDTVPNYLLVITRSVDGLPTVQAINELKSRGTKVIGFGVDLSTSGRRYLEESVSSPTDQTLFLSNTALDLDKISVDFVSFLCQEKNMCAGNPCQNGGICENGEKNYVCRCPAGYAGIDCTRTCQDKADIVFLIDSSGSVGSDNFRRIKEYAQHVIDSLNIGSDATRIGVATFSQSSRAEIYLNSYDDKRKLQAAVSGITYEYGNTNTASGIKLARSSLFSEAKGNRPEVPDYLVVITDGLSNINHEATIPEAELARKQGIHIFAVGVGIGDPWELNGIASKPSDKNVFQINNWDGLWDISDILIDRTCRDSSVCDENPCLNDGVCVAGVGTYTCQCPHGYVGVNCELGCQTNLDIAIILDASASVGPANFDLMLQYISTLVKDLTVYGQEHRFAVITYSTEVKTIFSFNRYSTIQQILEAIQTTAYTSGSTNTAGGLRQAIQLFSSEFGDRSSANNVAILLTDGQSNVNYWDTIPAATDLKAKNVKIIAVGINLESADEINSIASSRYDVHRATSFKTLEKIEQDLIGNACSDRE